MTRRIIPARAGFTARSRGEVDTDRDHPRSRGVYRRLRRPVRVGGGSSPLARGLHPDEEDEPVVYMDHPRSRGVYRRVRDPCPRRGGSSPLARGLHVDGNDVVLVLGIIPARAGFTDLISGQCMPLTDHPRSRGVYPSQTSALTLGDGSSPLARGLPSTWSWPRQPAGIIPARAGFTTNLLSCSHTLWDHPRSRGVYWFSLFLCGTAWGSSPLARGLPPR